MIYVHVLNLTPKFLVQIIYGNCEKEVLDISIYMTDIIHDFHFHNKTSFKLQRAVKM